MSLQTPLEGLSDYRPSSRTRILLADIADKLELTSQERHVFLGGRLINEVDGFREERIARRLPS